MSASAASRETLAARKWRLQARSAMLRGVLAEQLSRTLTPACTAADRARAGMAWLHGHPALTVGAAAALLVWRPRGVWRWCRRGWAAWQLWQRLQPAIKAVWPPRSGNA